MRKDRTRAKLKASGRTVKDIIMERNVAFVFYAATMATVMRNGAFGIGLKFQMMMKNRGMEYSLTHREKIISVNSAPMLIEVTRRIKKTTQQNNKRTGTRNVMR